MTDHHCDHQATDDNVLALANIAPAVTPCCNCTLAAAKRLEARGLLEEVEPGVYRRVTA